MRTKRDRLAFLGSPLERASLMRRGIFATVILALSFGACTLLFWYSASALGLVNLSEGALYLVRGAGLFGLMLGALGLLILLGAFQRAALPVADLVESAEQVAKGQYDVEVVERGPRELRALARSFNQMAAELRRQDQARSAIGDYLLSDLQTAINGLVDNVEQMLAENQAAANESLFALRDSTRHLTQALHEFEVLNAAESGRLKHARATVDVSGLVSQVLEGLHPLSSSIDIALHAAVPEPPLVVRIDAARVSDILHYIISDALQHSAAGAEVNVEVSKFPNPPRVGIAVSHHGASITAKSWSFRTDATDGAEAPTRIPLAIADRLAHAIGGEIAVETTPASGNTVTLLLPLVERGRVSESQ